MVLDISVSTVRSQCLSIMQSDAPDPSAPLPTPTTPYACASCVTRSLHKGNTVVTEAGTALVTGIGGVRCSSRPRASICVAKSITRLPYGIARYVARPRSASGDRWGSVFPKESHSRRNIKANWFEIPCYTMPQDCNFKVCIDVFSVLDVAVLPILYRLLLFRTS